MAESVSRRILKAANAILVGGGVLSLLCLSYVVHRNGWTGSISLNGQLPHLLKYLFPLIAAALLFGSLRLRPSARVGLAIVLCSTALSLYAIELVVQLVERLGSRERDTLWTPWNQHDLDELVRLAQRYGVNYDTRSKFEVVSTLRSADPGVSPVIVPKALLTPQADGTLKSRIEINGHEVLPLGGISNRSTVFCNESGEWISYRSDEHGFHNPTGAWNRGDVDVAVLGDSYVQGVCVPSARNAVSLVRERYPATLNLGMLGNGPLMELALLKEYAAVFRPRVVLWVLYEENDFADLEGTRKSPLLMKYLDASYRQGLLALQPAIDKALDDYVADEMDQRSINDDETVARPGGPTFLTVARSILFLRSVRGRLGLAIDSNHRTDHRVVSDETMDLLRKIFAEAKRTTAAWGGTLYLVYLPERQRYADRRAAVLNETNRIKTLSMAQELDIPVIDIHTAIQTHEDPLSLYPFRRRGHFNEDGYYLVAQSMLRSIKVPIETALRRPSS